MHGRDEPVHRGVAGVERLVPRAVDEELHRAGGEAAAQPERVLHPRCVQSQDPAPPPTPRRTRRRSAWGGIPAGSGRRGRGRGSGESAPRTRRRPRRRRCARSPRPSPRRPARPGTMGALGWIEPLAWVSSKSSEWPRLPLNSAAAGGEYAAPSPMTLALPEPRPRWRSAAAIEALSPASLRPRMEMPTWSRSSIRVRSTTSGIEGRKVDSGGEFRETAGDSGHGGGPLEAWRDVIGRGGVLQRPSVRRPPPRRVARPMVAAPAPRVAKG